MIGAGYRAGLYHGYSVPLGALDIFDLPGFDCYWSDAGNRPVTTRGNAITQGPEVTIAGVKFDLDVVASDLQGGLPFMASRDASPDSDRIVTPGDVG
jgi:hypothetical protein